MNLGYLFIFTFLFSAIVYWFIPKQSVRNIFITIVSAAFVFLLDKSAFAILFFLTLYVFGFSFLVAGSHKKSFYHKLSVSGIVMTLAVFKYAGFLDKYFSNVINYFNFSNGHPFENLLIPLGLSYVTFKYISYLTDLYWGLNKRAGFFDLFFYGSLFTIFLSGPIERFERIEKQLNGEKIRFSSVFVLESFERISYGLFKKFVLADWLGYFIGFVWRNPDEYSFVYHTLALFGFSLQLYFDFSGYSDIAIGTSRMFGFKMMENFNFPYLRQNISQFWRNWHISLSDWIRDYLFFPLSRFSTHKVWLLIFVPLIAMGICGMWHGSELKFLAWGLYHGAGISVYQLWNQFKKKRKVLKNFTETKIFNAFAVLITFVFVTMGWLFFK
jgi:D-alanyl-lipoteichoic acid acyltransferase DltB (MBOAT superfamily)